MMLLLEVLSRPGTVDVVSEAAVKSVQGVSAKLCRWMPGPTDMHHTSNIVVGFVQRVDANWRTGLQNLTDVLVAFEIVTDSVQRVSADWCTGHPTCCASQGKPTYPSSVCWRE